MKIRFLFKILIFIVTWIILASPLSAERTQPRTHRPGQPRELTQIEKKRVEGYMNYFSYALFRYYCVYGYYPTSADRLVDSGLIVVWPVNPLTRKPVRIIRDIREGEYHFAGELCYEYKSPRAGFFKGLFETTRSDGWEYHEFPDGMDESKLKQLKKSNPDSYSEIEPYRFAKSIVSLFGTFKDIHLDEKTGKLPKSTEELFDNHFKIIREFYLPRYNGNDEEHAGFYELGVDLQAGFWYSIYKIRPDYTNRFAHRYPYKGLSLNQREFEGEDFPDIKHKLPLLSPSLYNNVKDLPDKLLMSVDDIEFVRD